MIFLSFICFDALGACPARRWHRHWPRQRWQRGRGRPLHPRPLWMNWALWIVAA